MLPLYPPPVKTREQIVDDLAILETDAAICRKALSMGLERTEEGSVRDRLDKVEAAIVVLQARIRRASHAGSRAARQIMERFQVLGYHLTDREIEDAIGAVVAEECRRAMEVGNG